MAISTPDAIFNELDRLGLSTNQDSFSGLMVVEENSAPYSPYGNDIEVVKIYDDHADGFYDGLNLLEFLKGLKVGEVVLSGDTTDNVWQQIKYFEVYDSPRMPPKRAAFGQRYSRIA
jgi:hypothetical protein